MSLNGTWLRILSQLGLVLLAMMLGKLTGGVLHLQRMSNQLGQYARERIGRCTPGLAQAGERGLQRLCVIVLCRAAGNTRLGGGRLVRIHLSAGGKGGDGRAGDHELCGNFRLGLNHVCVAGICASRLDHFVVWSFY